MRSIFSKWSLIKFCKVAPLTVLMVLASGCISTMTEPSAGGRVSVADDSVVVPGWTFSPRSPMVLSLEQRFADAGVLLSDGHPLVAALMAYPARNIPYLEKTFESESAFLGAVRRELLGMHGRGHIFGPRRNGAFMFGVQTQNTLVPLSEDEAALVAIVTSSTNSKILPGDMIIACAGDRLMPGRDMAVIAGLCPEHEMSCSLTVIREEAILTVTARLRFVPMAASEVLTRRCLDAIEAAILNRTVELLGVRVWWRENCSPPPNKDHLQPLMANALCRSYAVKPVNRLTPGQW